MFERQIMPIVRCRATSYAVPLDICQGTEEFGQCPYYGGQKEGGVIKCAYDPAKPKRVLTPEKRPRENDRQSFHTGKNPKVHQLFAVYIPGKKNEWASAQVNK